MLQWIWGYRYLLHTVNWFPDSELISSGYIPRSRIIHHVVVLFSIFSGGSILVSTMAVPIRIPTSRARGQSCRLGSLHRPYCKQEYGLSTGFISLSPFSTSIWSPVVESCSFPSDPCEVRPRQASWETSSNGQRVDVHRGLCFSHRRNHRSLEQRCAGLGEGQHGQSVAAPLPLLMRSFLIPVV